MHPVYNPRGTKYCPQWFNNLDQSEGAVTREISWIAFPKRIKRDNPDDETRWKLVDEDRLGTQDEYCEWWVQKNDSGKVVSVTFSCENPEYWELLALTDRRKLVSLYNQLLGTNKVKESHLFKINGQYNRRNKWNNSSQTGVIHLAQVNNTLGAEIDIAARATLVRLKDDGTPKTDDIELTECSGYGDPNRNSDPHIGGEVNALARQGYLVSITEPAALYIKELFIPDGSWETPDGTDPNTFWTVVRGTADTSVRCVFKVPESLGYVVGDIKIDSKNIRYGGQLADYISIKLTGLAKNKSDANIKGVKGCWLG